MAEKISVQIALEGGAEVERQLKGIGEAGQKAFLDLAKSAEQVGGFKNLKMDEVTSSLKAAGVEGKELAQILKAVGTATKFETLVQGVKGVETAFVALGRAAGPIGAAIVTGLTAAAKATIAFADTINKASDQAVKLGLSLEQLKTFQKDFEKLGVSGDAAAAGFAKFQQELQKAAQADPGSNLANFGQSAEAARQQLDQFIAQLRQMPDGLNRTNLAIATLGQTAGTQVIQGLRAAEGSMSGAERKAYDLGQAIERLKRTWDSLGTVTFAPALTAGIDAIDGALQRLQARAEQNPWGTLVQGAALLNPIHAVVQGLEAAIAAVGQAAMQSGQQAASGFQVWNEELGKAVPAAQTASTGITAAFQSILPAIQAAGSAVSDFISQIGRITWDAISSAGVAAWDALTSAIQSAIDKLLTFIGLKPSAPATGDGAPGKAGGGLIGGRGTGTSDSNLAWLSRGEHIMPAHVVRQPGVLAFLEAMRRRGGIPGYAEGGLPFIRGFQMIGGGGLADKIGNWIVTIAQANNAMMRTILDLTENLKRAAEQFSNQLFRVTEDMQNTRRGLPPGLAGGGLFGGRGSGTSDSNLAWVSRGEYITPARAVRQPGVLDFLEALRRSGGNLSAVLDGMGRFALGGLVPRLAAGGAIGGMSHVTINFPGTPPISGLRASAGVVDQLQKAAALAQVRSGGRKPSRYS